MSQLRDSDESSVTDTHREYIMDVRIVEVRAEDGLRYRFEAPKHRGIEFDDPDLAELYADVYFDVNGFQEDGTGDRGLPPEIVQGGRDTMAAYLLTQYEDDDFVASFYGVDPGKVARYVEWVQVRAEEVRANALEQGVA
jgi:hypothetical protein